jgi:DNA (cytosine-5)-methyltransferase 1
VVEPYVLPAAAAIDWADLGSRIGDRRRPLAANTLRRIQTGLDMFARPTMLAVNHDDDGRPYPADAAPLPARTVKIGDGLACPPMLVPSGGTWNDTPVMAGDPMRTRTARDTDALVTPEPFITLLRNHQSAAGVDQPLATVTAGGQRGGGHQYLTVPPGAFYVKNYGGQADPRRLAKDVREPLGTVVANGSHHALVVPYYRTGRAKHTGQPLDTVTSHDRFALVAAAVQVEDCRFRMLKPREHLRAQRFPEQYVVHGNQGEQTMQAGNAVSANVAQWLGHRVAQALDTR